MRAMRSIVMAGCLCLLVSGVRSDENLTVGQHDFEGTAGLVWESYSAGEGFRAESGSGIALSPDQRTVFVVGTRTILLDGFRPITKVLVRAYDARSGQPKWTAIYPEAPESSGTLGSFAVSPDGQSLYVAGQDPNAPTTRAFVLALDAVTGAQRWLALRNPQDLGAGASGVLVSNSGDRVYAGGFSETRGVVWAFDAATGALLWQNIYRPAPGVVLWVTALAHGPDDSRFIAIGTVPVLVGNTLWNDTFTVGFNADNGQHLWEMSDTGGTWGRAVSSPDGTQLIREIERLEGGGVEIALSAMDAATGAQQWTRSLGPGFPEDKIPCYSADGSRLFVVPFLLGGRHVMALDPVNGDMAWDVTDFEGMAPLTLAAAPRGERLVVAGFIGSSPPTSYAVMGLDAATGARVWFARTTGPDATPNSFSGVFDVTIRSRSRGNEVFVTGTMQRFLSSGMSEHFVGTLEYCEPSFGDVPCEFFAWRFIEAVAEAGVAAGFVDETFRPNLSVTRGQLADFLARAADRVLDDLAAFSPPACGAESFSDVDCGHFAYQFIEYIAAKGLAAGFPDGTFRPDAVVNRGAMAVFLARVRDLTDGDLSSFVPPDCKSESFPDVRCIDADYRFIEYIAVKGIASGFSDGTYRPDASVTRGHMAVFLVRAAGVAL